MNKTENIIYEISEKYSKVWEEFIEDFLPQYEFFTNMTFYPEYGLSIINNGIKIRVPFELFYAIMEDFFYNNETEIFTYKHNNKYGYLIHYNKNSYYSEKYNLKIDAKYQVILKAAELLEIKFK